MIESFTNQSIHKETNKIIKVNNLQIADTIYGIGNIHLLALHGWEKEGKATLLPALKFLPYNKYTIHAPDLPGFGQSDNLSKNSWSLNDYSNFIIQYLEKQNSRNPINIVGHSFGGRIILRLATLNPNTVNKIILINSDGISDVRNYTHKIMCPTLILWGSEDIKTPPWQAKELVKLIPNSNLFVWPKAGHYSHLDQPLGTSKAIDLFLNI